MTLSNRQQEIMETSMQIIYSKGIQSLTIKNLSKEIGISEPAIYRHFDSKTSILMTILDNFGDMASFMAEAMKEMEDSAISKLEFMFSRIVSIFTETPSYISVIFSEEIFKSDELLKDRIISILNLNEHTVENIILEGQNKGEIRTDVSHTDLALIVMGSLRFRVKQWDLKKCSDDLNVQGIKLLNSLKTIISKTQN